MTLEKTNARKNRYTVYLTDDENDLIRYDATTVKGYGNKAVGRYCRETILSSLSHAKTINPISIPTINASTALDLNGAVTNLNQSVKTLNRIALSEPLSAQSEQANRMMLYVMKIANTCKDFKNFLDGNIGNKKLLATLAGNTFSSEELRYLADHKDKEAR
jgi:negative regulator of replication initiation